MDAPELPLNESLGQVWTPSPIALEMAIMALKECTPGTKRVLDPACGPATFTTALRCTAAKDIELSCFDIDERMIRFTEVKNKASGFASKTQLKDYLGDTSLNKQFDLVIMNPPYIRHEKIPAELKDMYHAFLKQELNTEVDRRANMFALFLLKAIIDLKPGGVLCAIVYDAISNSQYGKQVLFLLTKHAEFISSKHVIAPFNEVLVDARILLYRKRETPINEVNITSGNETPKGITKLENLINARRGTGLSLRKAFIAEKDDLYFKHASPLLVKQARLDGLIAEPDAHAYLIEPGTQPNSDFFKWLKQRADKFGVAETKLLNRPVHGPLLFNYYVRNAPRHLWNPNQVAATDNFYVSSPKDGFPTEAAWLLLNSDIYLDSLVAAGRNQGNGLTKLQLFEYKGAFVPDWRLLPKRTISSLVKAARALIDERAGYQTIRQAANKKTKPLFHA